MGNAYMKWRDREDRVPKDDRHSKAEDGAGSPPPSPTKPPTDISPNVGTPASNVFDTSLARGGIQPVHF
jgi:hypothetical protein